MAQAHDQVSHSSPVSAFHPCKSFISETLTFELHDRPGIFSPVAALARPGPSGSHARPFTRQISRDTQEEADGDLRGLAIIASARDPEDAPAGAGVRGRTSVRRSLHITSLIDSSSPRRLAASKASAEPTLENTTFIRMLSALNRKPE